MKNKVVDCLVGLQWGSEGKGKVSAYLAPEYNAMVRSGGPQAGHTFFHNDLKYINRQIPCGVINPNCLLYLSANSLINIDVLGSEIRKYKIYPDRLMVDNHAMVITDKHINREQKSSLKNRLASTTEGVGAAQSEKIWREGYLFDHYAKEDPELYFFSNDTVKAINKQIQKKHPVLLEGTQGFGLSLNHGEYPYVTSRDVTSPALLSDAGISPAHYNQTIGVMRTYPIRVSGNSGPTHSNELTWEEIANRSVSPKPLIEYTTVTGRTRRIFEQDFETLEKAILVNQPDQIAIMFLDYICAGDYGKTKFEDLSAKSQKYIDNLEEILNIPITLIGTGPNEKHIIDLREDNQKRHPAEKPLEDLDGGLWPINFYGSDWDSGYIEEFLDRKMTDEKGNPFKRKIFC